MDNENTKVGRKAKNDLYNAAFAVRLRELFEENNITQATAAEKLGTTRQTIGNWLLGKSQPDFEMFVKLADFFDVTTDYLLGRTGNKTTDIEIQAISEYTGLNEESIKYFHSKSIDEMDFVNFLFSFNGIYDKKENILLSHNFDTILICLKKYLFLFNKGKDIDFIIDNNPDITVKDIQSTRLEGIKQCFGDYVVYYSKKQSLKPDDQSRYIFPQKGESEDGND